MATIDSNLAGKVISTTALEAFTNKLCPLNAFTTSFDSEAGQKGDQIIIPFVPEFANDGSTTVATFTAGSSDYSSSPTNKITQATIDLDSHIFTNWSLNDTEVAENSIAQLERFGSQKGNDLATTVFVSICSTITAANFGTKTKLGTTASSVTLDMFLAARAQMVANGGDPSQCSWILNSAYYAGLLSLTEFTADNYGSSEPIKQGQVPSFLGIPNVYECPNLPENSEALAGMLVHNSALGVAFRYLEPNSGGASAYTRVDKLTNDDGMTMGYRQFYKPESGESFGVLEALYGYKKIYGDALIRLTAEA